MNSNEKNLIRRYLVWCYKDAKEALDKVDRYFTQDAADNFVFTKLKEGSDYTSAKGDPAYKKKVDDFALYMDKKQQNVLKKKFTDSAKGSLQPEYQYLQNRFSAIEDAITHFLGAKELTKICSLYEEEMTLRILQAREH